MAALNNRPSTRTCAIILLAWDCSIFPKAGDSSLLSPTTPRDGEDCSRFPDWYDDSILLSAFLGDHNPNRRKLWYCGTPVKDVPLLHNSCKLVWSSAPLSNSPLEESVLSSLYWCPPGRWRDVLATHWWLARIYCDSCSSPILQAWFPISRSRVTS